MTFRLAIIVGLSAMLFVSAAPAQQKLELFGGYQYARPDGGPNLNGWNAALTGNFTRNFGITGDFGGTYGGGGSMYTFAFGPKVSGSTSGCGPSHMYFLAERAWEQADLPPRLSSRCSVVDSMWDAGT